MFQGKKRLNLILLLLFINSSYTAISQVLKTDTIPKTISIPVVDGSGTDDCWKTTGWLPINQLWLGQPVDSSDFHGKYKVVWDSTLLYFLIEIVDDNFVTGYNFSSSNSNPTSWNYDIVEVFIDEDNSGGLHITNNGAFAYHMACHIPEDGKTVNELSAGDWNNSVWTNLQSHFSKFAVKREGQNITWEFSLIVYNSTLQFDKNEAQARVTLNEDKKMGLSVAYCDADGGYGRDSFIGSTGGAKASDHYRDASLFGKVILGSKGKSGITKSIWNRANNSTEIKVFPNPVIDNSFNIRFENVSTGKVDIELLKINGTKILKKTCYKSQQEFHEKIQIPDMQPGMYLIKIITKEGIYGRLISK